MFGADVVPHPDKNQDLFVRGDAKALFGDALEVIKSSDRFIINLDGSLTDRGEPIRKCGANFRRAPRCVNALLAAGVTDVMLANNCVFD